MRTDSFQVTLRDHRDRLQGEWTVGGHERRGVWFWNWVIDGTPGTWRLDIWVNEVTAATHTITVRSR